MTPTPARAEVAELAEVDLDRFALLTVRQYAEFRKVSAKTVRAWIARRLVDAVRKGGAGHWRIKVPRA